MEVDIQREIFKKMTPEQKLIAAFSLIHSVRQLKFAQFKKEFADLTKKEIEEKVKKHFLYAST